MQFTHDASLKFTARIFGSIAIILFLAINTEIHCKGTMSSLDNITKDGVVPDVIDTQPRAEIKVDFDSGVSAKQGNELTPTQVKNLPKISFEAKADQFYTIVKVDPDAPSRQEPKFREILHYMVANVPGNDLTKGDTVAEYIGSGAPKGTGLHRYIFLVYHQKDGRYTAGKPIPKTSREGRISFSIRKFAKEHNLGEPIAANFYQAQYDDYVPILHAQLGGVKVPESKKPE